MNIKSHVPNALTLGNLLCGSIAAINITVSFDQTLAVMLIFLAAILDLLDGAVARLLKVSGDLGKQLDSLADVVSFGLVPSVIIYKTLELTLPENLQWLRYLAFLNVICAAIRLARFNIATDQTHDFRGMPSPANGIFWASVLAIYAWIRHTNQINAIDLVMLPYSTTIILLLVTSLLMVSNIRMFSFKMKGGFSANRIQWIFISLIVVLAIWAMIFTSNVLFVIPSAILLYITFSVIYHFTTVRIKN